MILLEKAVADLNKGDVEKVAGELREATAVSPDFAEAHYQLGLALSRLPARAAEAEASFRRVLQLNPNHA